MITPKVQCDSPFVETSIGCIYFPSVLMTWCDARQLCIDNGGDLIYPDSSTEWETIATVLLENKSNFIKKLNSYTMHLILSSFDCWLFLWWRRFGTQGVTFSEVRMKTSSERNFIGDISTRYLWSFSSIDKFFTKNPTYIIDSKMFVSYLQFYKNNFL